jgi:hypothetical protein
MAKIFISHSARDRELKNFFNDAFGTSPVEALYEEIEKEEIEKLYRGIVTTNDIERDITLSNALFVLLSSNVDSIDHTRDWVGYEVGFAKGMQSGRNRDVWIFEHVNAVGHLKKVIPNFDHYVIYDESDVSLKYIKAIVDSYDDGRVWRNAAIGVSGGAAIAKEDRLGGAVVGGIASLIYSALSTGRPQGREVICGCSLKYQIHIPERFLFYPCPNCRKLWPKPGSVAYQLP